MGCTTPQTSMFGVLCTPPFTPHVCMHPLTYTPCLHAESSNSSKPEGRTERIPCGDWCLTNNMFGVLCLSCSDTPSTSPFGRLLHNGAHYLNLTRFGVLCTSLITPHVCKAQLTYHPMSAKHNVKNTPYQHCIKTICCATTPFDTPHIISPYVQ